VVSIPAQEQRPAQKAQSLPTEEKKLSLKETTDFLKEKIVANAFYEHTSDAADGKVIIDFRVEDVQIDGCALTIKTAETSSFKPSEPPFNGPRGTTNDLDKIELTDLDAKRVTVTEFQGSGFVLKMGTIDDRKSVHHHFEKKDYRSTGEMTTQFVADESLPTIHILFTDKDMANRIANAFVHAIGLCSTKKEPF